METKDKKVFVFGPIHVFFKHTDYHGFVHSYNFYEWTSYVREAFFQETVSNFMDVVMRPIKMMTVKIYSNILGEAIFGDSLIARLTVGKIKRVSFDMNVYFFNKHTQKMICKTSHSIVFVDSTTGKFGTIPKEMMDVIIHYEEMD